MKCHTEPRNWTDSLTWIRSANKILVGKLEGTRKSGRQRSTNEAKFNRGPIETGSEFSNWFQTAEVYGTVTGCCQYTTEPSDFQLIN